MAVLILSNVVGLMCFLNLTSHILKKIHKIRDKKPFLSMAEHCVYWSFDKYLSLVTELYQIKCFNGFSLFFFMFLLTI